MGYLHPGAAAWPLDCDDSSADEAILRERMRLAGELHDVIAQNFQYILLQLRAARGMLGVQSGAAGRHVGVAEERLRECWDELRSCIHGLAPGALARGTLVSALGRYVATLCDAGPAEINFELCGTPYPVAPAIESQLLRIAQEAVTNAMCHSGGTRIAVELSFDADAVRLTVTDNGAGFHVQRASGGPGLSGMRDRARRAGGELAIDSDLGRGTEVRVTVPRSDATDVMLSR